MKFSRGAIALYMGLVFASGAVLGVYGQRLYSVSTVTAPTAKRRPSPEEFRKRLLTTMETRLQLSPEQVTQWGLIMDETRARFEEANAKTRPEMQAIRKEENEKLRAILSPKQWAEYESYVKERQEKGKRVGGRPPGPGF